jgi:hypothetical protein
MALSASTRRGSRLIRSRIFLIAAGTLAVSLFSTSTSDAQGRGNLVLTATKDAHGAKAVSGSSWYFAEVFNNGNESQVLQAIQMPGGYAGEGKFFSCKLEAWDTAQHRWHSIWSAPPGHKSNLRDIELPPHGTIRVCALSLPEQAGRQGQCVRFGFRPRWDKSAAAILSNPILTGDKVPHGPCRAEAARPLPLFRAPEQPRLRAVIDLSIVSDPHTTDEENACPSRLLHESQHSLGFEAAH